MELRCYDTGLNLKSVVENFTSLQWTRKYNECGDFSVTAPLTESTKNAFSVDSIVWVKGKPDGGIVESITMNSEIGSGTITASGRFLPGVMGRRLIYPKFNFSGRIEEIMREMFSQAQGFPNIVLGDDNGFEDELESVQASYKDLLTYEQNLAKSANFGIRFRPDDREKLITFEIYKGLDRSLNQRERPRVVFSDEYENLANVKYTDNTSLHYNVCVVGGQSNQDYKYYETVGDDTTTGYNRREVYFESDVQSNGLTWEQYVAALRQRGQTILDQSLESESFECSTQLNGNFKYQVDYDLGDIVSIYKSAWGIERDMRITEVREVYETEQPRIDLVFGTPLPTTINWEV